MDIEFDSVMGNKCFKIKIKKNFFVFLIKIK